MWYASSFDHQGRPTPAKQSINSPSSLPRASGIFPFQVVLLSYFLSAGGRTSRILGLRGVSYFSIPTFIVDVSRAPSILLPRSEICKDGLYTWENTSPGKGKGQRKNPNNKEFDMRNIRRWQKFLFVFFFFLLNFFSCAIFRSHERISWLKFPQYPHIYGCRFGFFPTFVCS